MEEKRYSRQALLTALEKGWKQYLQYLEALPQEEQARYAQAQGFPRAQDLLAHIFAWWEISMRRTREMLSGQEVPALNDMDEINAATLAKYRDWTRSAIENKFTETLATFERFLHNLPETALENERIHLWLRIDAIDHYDDHRLAGAPRISEQM
jgi:hypothetical protein